MSVNFFQYHKIFSLLSTEDRVPATLIDDEEVETEISSPTQERVEPTSAESDADASAAEPANSDSGAESNPATADQPETASTDSEPSSSVEEPLPPNGGDEAQPDAPVAEEAPPKVDAADIPDAWDDSVGEDDTSPAEAPSAAAAQPSDEVDADTDEWNEDWTEEEARCHAVAGHSFRTQRLPWLGPQL